MNLEQAQPIAEKYRDALIPHCLPGYCKIAGSTRREKPEVGDIEIVCVPLAYDTGLFTSGIASVINPLVKIKGELPCKYTQRMLPEGILLDLFICTPETFWLNFCIRTGSADWVHQVLATRWTQLGYHSEGAILRRNGERHIVHSEQDLFAMLGMAWVEPRDRVMP